MNLCKTWSLYVFSPPFPTALHDANSHQQKRAFDPLDILSNIIGSAAGLLLCTWYHRRMLERKRLAKNPYQPVSGDDDVEFDQGAEELRDLESAGGPSGSTADGDTNRIKSKD